MHICPYKCPYSCAWGSYRASFPIFPKFSGLTKDHSSCICTGHNLPKFTELMAFVNFSNFFGSKKVKKTGCDFADAVLYLVALSNQYVFDVYLAFLSAISGTRVVHCITHTHVRPQTIIHSLMFARAWSDMHSELLVHDLPCTMRWPDMIISCRGLYHWMIIPSRSYDKCLPSLINSYS